MDKFINWLLPAHGPITFAFEQATTDLRVCNGMLQRRVDVVTERHHHGWEWPETVSRVPEWRDVPVVAQ